jgi:hypothetical protein
MKLISAKGYASICEHLYCSRYGKTLNPQAVKEGDYVFVNTDDITEFTDKVLQGIDVSVSIVTQNSDSDFTAEMADTLFRHGNVSKVYAINNCSQDNRVVSIPIGFTDNSLSDVHAAQDSREKKNKVYVNFKPAHHAERLKCLGHLADPRNSEFVCIDQDAICNKPTKSYSGFYQELSEYAFAAAPRGAGVDTHRLYECIKCGVTPIVLKSELEMLHNQFPIVMIDSWGSVDVEHLICNADMFRHNLELWKDSNPYWANAIHWIKP